MASEEWAGQKFPRCKLLLRDDRFAGCGRPVKRRRGKELCALYRHYNFCSNLAQIRVEHVLSGGKRSRIVSDELRNRKSGFANTVMELACGLHNFRGHHQWRHEPSPCKQRRLLTF